MASDSGVRRRRRDELFLQGGTESGFAFGFDDAEEEAHASTGGPSISDVLTKPQQQLPLEVVDAAVASARAHANAFYGIGSELPPVDPDVHKRDIHFLFEKLRRDAAQRQATAMPRKK